jgi:hypothetical protein
MTNQKSLTASVSQDVQQRPGEVGVAAVQGIEVVDGHHRACGGRVGSVVERRDIPEAVNQGVDVLPVVVREVKDFAGGDQGFFGGYW